MKKLVLVSFILLICSTGYSQQKLALIDLEKYDSSITKLFHNYKAYLLHRADNLLLMEINNELAEAIKPKILDNSLNFEKYNYYLVYEDINKSNEQELENLGNILVKTKSFLILKTYRNVNSELAHYSSKFFKLKSSYRHFDNSISYLTRNRLTYDPEIDEMVNAINADTLEYFIQSLEDFETRYWSSYGCEQSANWIKSEFERFGYSEVVLDSFLYNGSNQKNVVATLPGSENPEYSIVIGAHYDSILFDGDPGYFAPGADDNASGVAGVLEIARIFKQFNFQPEVSFKFITFAAEEVGLVGSDNYAFNAANNDENIVAMINMDMIAYIEESSQWKVKIRPYDGGDNLNLAVENALDLYTDLSFFYASYNEPSSDGYSFYYHGFPVTSLHEPVLTPYYHTQNDLLINLNIDYCKEMVKPALAGSIIIIDYPIPPVNFTIQCLGNGEEAELNWNYPEIGNYDSFNIYLGTTSGNYDEIFSANSNSFLLTDLIDNQEYYIGISSYYSENDTESTIIEKTFTPHSVPFAPTGVCDSPTDSEIILTWNENNELDLAGYHIYRSEISGELGEICHETLLTTTEFTDSNVLPDKYYYYSITALDDSCLESASSQQIRSKLTTLDQGILVVNTSPDGSGTICSPTRADLDDFYSYLTTGLNSESLIMEDIGNIKLADLGAYSSVILQSDSRYTEPYDNNTIIGIKEYLDIGGNLLISSFLPTRLFGAPHNYPYEFQSGDFIYDYLKIASTDFSQTAFFNEAVSENEYSSLEIDPEKTYSAMNHHLPFVSSISPNSNSNIAFTYGTDFDPASSQGAFAGTPVGINYFANDYNLVVLSFPLFYTLTSQAKDFVDYVLINQFNETVSNELNLVPSVLTRLGSNYPNPFNPETTISFSLNEAGPVELTIYNIKGQLVKRLKNENLAAGSHSAEWNGKDSNNKSVTSGIYFYKLKTSQYTSTKKMILMK